MTTRILEGHALDVLAQMPAASVQAVCTSPPYWLLRAYNTVPQVWANPDDTPLCVDGAHEWGATIPPYKPGQVEQSKWKNAIAAGAGQTATRGNVCQSCGAWRGELGSEPELSRYLANLVSVFRALRRVLRPDGVLAVNLGGSYYNNPGGQNGTSGNVSERAIAANGQAGRQERISHENDDLGLKPLDWVDVPGMFARAMQRDGWTWRSDIALVKKAPLPESVNGTRFERCRVKVTEAARSETANGRAQSAGLDEPEKSAQWADCPGCQRCQETDGYVLRRGSGRPTRAWERLLIFAAGPGYFWDSDAVRQQMAESSVSRLAQDVMHQQGSWRANGGAKTNGAMKAVGNPDAGRNLLDWQIWPHAPTKEQHYAAYPVALPTLIIKAATSERGACSVCGAPWARVVKRTPMVVAHSDRYGAQQEQGLRLATAGTMAQAPSSNTIGWRPTCLCASEAPPVPCVVLDPFAGIGSTLIAADRLGRDAVGIEIKPEYVSIAVRRATNDAPLFAQVEVA